MRYTAKVVYSKRYRRDDDDDGADIVVPIQAEESLRKTSIAASRRKNTSPFPKSRKRANSF